MIRFFTTLFAVLAATLGVANAQSDLVKRGGYLVNGIMTCGNCHSPKGPTGDIPGKEFSGGLSLGRAAVQGNGAEYHPRQGNRHREVERCRHQKAAAHRRAAERRAHRDDHADRLLPHHGRARSRQPASHICARSKPINNKVPRSPIYQMPQTRTLHARLARRSPAYGNQVKTTRNPYTDMEYYTRDEPCASDTRLGAGGFDFPGPGASDLATNITSSKTKGSMEGGYRRRDQARDHDRRVQGR